MVDALPADQSARREPAVPPVQPDELASTVGRELLGCDVQPRVRGGEGQANALASRGHLGDGGLGRLVGTPQPESSPPGSGAAGYNRSRSWKGVHRRSQTKSLSER